MERNALLICLGLVVSVLATPVVARRLQEFNDLHSSQNPDIKPDCDCPTPSHGGGGSPSHGGGGIPGGHPTPTPSHGGGGIPSGNPKPTPTPSHGSGGTPSGNPKPTPTPSHGGGSSSGTPSTPTPSHGGGGYYHSPPTQTPSPIVLPPVTPTPSSPSSPVTAPVNPTPTPSTPDPHTPPFFPGTCNYWSTHPAAIWAIFGYLGNIGQSFGTPCASAFGKNLSLPDALSNTRADGIGALYREGTAALLNSLACKTYPLTTQQVKDAFAAAVVSNSAAARQARIFKLANEGGGLGH